MFLKDFSFFIAIENVDQIHRMKHRIYLCRLKFYRSKYMGLKLITKIMLEIIYNTENV